MANGFRNKGHRKLYEKSCFAEDGTFDMKVFNTLHYLDRVAPNKTKQAVRDARDANKKKSKTAGGCGPAAACGNHPENRRAAIEPDAQNKTAVDPTRGRGDSVTRSMEGQEAGRGHGRNGEMTS